MKEWREHIFLLTDIQGSTRLWELHPNAMAEALAQHDALIEEVVAAHGGRTVKARGEGDATFNVFGDGPAAVDAAVALQRRLSTASWPDGIEELRVRMSVHGGPVRERDGDFHGPTVNRAARLRSAGHGGQVLVSGTVAGTLGSSVVLRDHGLHRLADLNEPEHIHEVVYRDDLEHPGLRTLETAAHNLPQGLDALIGRDRELQDLKLTLRLHDLATLVGPAGAGKTRLATETAALVTPEFRDGSLLVELAPIRTDGGVADAIAQALGASTAGSGEPLDTVVHVLAERELLLVLDNCEHVLEAAAQSVDRIIGSCPDVTVLATSQVALGVADEVIVHIDTLELPTDDDVASVTRAPASALFLQRARKADERFVVDEHSAPAVASVCRRVDGLPLALELAAARIRHAGPDEIDRQLDRRFGVLRGGDTSDERHRTMHNAIAWSHDLLDEHDRVVLHACGTFAGPFRLADVEQLLDHAGLNLDAWSGVSELADRSLVSVRRTDGVTTYQLLESVRDFARAAAERDGTGEQLRDAHLAWVDDLTGEPRNTWDPRALADLRSAMAHGLDAGDVSVVGRLAPRLEKLLFHRGALAEARSWMEQLVERADQLGVDDQVLCLGLLADECHLLGDRDAAERWAEAAEARLPDVTELAARVRAGTLLGKLASRRGDTGTARRLWTRAIADGEELGDATLLVNPVGAAVRAHMRAGEFDEARILLEPLRDRLPRDAVSYAQASWTLAEILMRSDPDRAAVLLEQALDVSWTMRERPWMLAGAGALATLRGGDGRDLADDALDVAQQRDDLSAVIGTSAVRLALDAPRAEADPDELLLVLDLVGWCSNGQEGPEGPLLALARTAGLRGRTHEALVLLAAANTRAAPPLTDRDRQLVLGVLDEVPDGVEAAIAQRKGRSTEVRQLVDLAVSLARPS